MNRKTKVVIAIILCVVLIVLFLWITKTIALTTGKTVFNEEGEDSLAKCLADKGMKMYGTEWCGHCQNMKNLFGEDFKDINFIDCDERKEECIKAGVQGYPTFEINGRLYPGEKTLKELKDLSGC